MRYPEKPKSSTESRMASVRHWGREMDSCIVNGREFQFCKMRRVREIGGKIV